MKLVSFWVDGQLHYGVQVKGGEVWAASAVAQAHGISLPPTVMDLIAAGPAALAQVRSLAALAETDELFPEETLHFAPAVPAPGKVICVGTNYRRHALESNLPIPEYPVYFSKYNNSLAGHRQDVPLPGCAQQFDYEVELVAVVGRRVRAVTPADALPAVFGYATGNDLSARDLQFRSSQWMFGKALDGFAPLGPYLVTADEIPDPQQLRLRCWVNGELRQDSNTADMIFSVAELISDLSQIMTLEPGDVVYTGTPEGVVLGMAEKCWLKAGDEVVCEVEGVGRLVNRLV
ncbi:fumarylacetoacetate hydrolase family protein [Kyrpidia sp.]|uniref:fumarylacetoacetate hydrolase family protein n=1 Tax=Kyrpidia sp. TaxID=2073077 RepID=UPI002585FA61|nr:fumarylacetoacetate hydrolase family protein [Kyrpidia sp.]MCL6577433.1 fumarylacetoacetate hydrolase family protein [Kyrpidia sp.]